MFSRKTAVAVAVLLALPPAVRAQQTIPDPCLWQGLDCSDRETLCKSLSHPDLTARWPVSGKAGQADKVTSAFGPRDKGADHFDFHEGLDLRTWTNGQLAKKPVYPAWEGRVVKIWAPCWQKDPQPGCETADHWVVLEHKGADGVYSNDDFYTSYHHLDPWLPWDGDPDHLDDVPFLPFRDLQVGTEITWDRNGYDPTDPSHFFVHSGNSGTDLEHLHFNTMVGGSQPGRFSVNPMRPNSLPYPYLWDTALEMAGEGLGFSQETSTPLSGCVVLGDEAVETLGFAVSSQADPTGADECPAPCQDQLDFSKVKLTFPPLGDSIVVDLDRHWNDDSVGDNAEGPGEPGDKDEEGIVCTGTRLGSSTGIRVAPDPFGGGFSRKRIRFTVTVPQTWLQWKDYANLIYVTACDTWSPFEDDLAQCDNHCVTERTRCEGGGLLRAAAGGTALDGCGGSAISILPLAGPVFVNDAVEVKVGGPVELQDGDVTLTASGVSLRLKSRVLGLWSFEWQPATEGDYVLEALATIAGQREGDTLSLTVNRTPGQLAFLDPSANQGVVFVGQKRVVKVSAPGATAVSLTINPSDGGGGGGMKETSPGSGLWTWEGWQPGSGGQSYLLVAQASPASVGNAQVWVKAVDPNGPRILAPSSGSTVAYGKKVQVVVVGPWDAQDIRLKVNRGGVLAEDLPPERKFNDLNQSVWDFAWRPGLETFGTPYVLEAYDNTGRYGPSSTVSVEVSAARQDTTAPSVEILYPRDGESIGQRGSRVVFYVSVSARDDQGIASVDLKVNGPSFASIGTSSSCGPWCYFFQVTVSQSGHYAVETMAKDGSGNSRTASIAVDAQLLPYPMETKPIDSQSFLLRMWDIRDDDYVDNRVSADTGVLSSRYACAIVGYKASGGDIEEEHGEREIIRAILDHPAETWRLNVNFKTGGKNTIVWPPIPFFGAWEHVDKPETWEATLLCVSRELASLDGPEADRPIFLKTYSGLGHDVYKPTEYRTSDYACGVAGFFDTRGDINEKDTRDPIEVYTYDQGGYWNIRAGFATHGDQKQDWTVSLICISTQIASLNAPQSGKRYFLKRLPRFNNPAEGTTGVSSNRYSCGVVGFRAFGGNIDEHGGKDGNAPLFWAYLYEHGDSTWHFRGDFRSEDDHEDWDMVNILCAFRGVNAAPVIQPIPRKAANPGMVVSYDVRADDHPEDSIRLSASNLPPGAVFPTTDGHGSVIQTFTWEVPPLPPDVEYQGVTVLFTATDGWGASTTAAGRIDVCRGLPPKNCQPPQNHPPYFDPLRDRKAVLERPFTLSVTARDVDDDGLTLTASGLPTDASFDITQNGKGVVTGVLSWIPTSLTSAVVRFNVIDFGDERVTRSVRITVTPRSQYLDSDGDARGDLVVFRPGNATWFVLGSRENWNAGGRWELGASGDVPLWDSDFDGDGRSDFAVWHPADGTWSVRTSASDWTTTFTRSRGRAGDVPIAADFDGDGQADMTVWRPSNGIWYVGTSGNDWNPTFSRQWGKAGDVPLPGCDFDGDGKADLAVWRPGDGTWYVSTSGNDWNPTFSRQIGRAGDIPIVGSDYDGDHRTDMVVWRPDDGVFQVLTSSSDWNTVAVRAQLGAIGDVPLGNLDFDGDDRTDLAVWRPRDGMWRVLTSSSNWTTGFERPLGRAGDIPIRDVDLDGDLNADLVVFRPGNGTWHALLSSQGWASPFSRGWGQAGDVASGLVDLEGGSRPDLAVCRPGDGTWSVRTAGSVWNQILGTEFWGQLGDVAVPGSDFDGDARPDKVVWKPGSGAWNIYTSGDNWQTFITRSLGQAGDVPLANSDFDGDRKADMVAWRPGTGFWYVLTSSSSWGSAVVRQWGTAGDLPVSADFDGDHKADMAVWRPSNGVWYVRTSTSAWNGTMSRKLGQAGDVPIGGTDFDGDGKADMAVWRPGTGTWSVLTSSSNWSIVVERQWGTPGDIPLGGMDFDGDGKAEMVVWRPGNGVWYALMSASSWTSSLSRLVGQSGDIPLAQADFDGDGKPDMAVWRPTDFKWYSRTSKSNWTATATGYLGGADGCIPLGGWSCRVEPQR
jgi:hypothetical protein